MVRRDVPTCRLHDTLHDVAARMRATRWDLCAVLDDEHVLLGLVDAGALRGPGSTPAERMMQSGPTTIRPHLTLDELGSRMKKRDHVLVTTSDGRFLGVLLRSDVERKMIEREHFLKGSSR
jgi:CBS domain-containing protein